MKLIFATHNQNKFNEVLDLLPNSIELLSLNDIGCTDEIPETTATLEGNAQIKADFVTQNYHLPCFSDDSGLLVDALNGAPGVYSARYAGEQKNAENNMDKLLIELKDAKTRTARFKAVVALNLNGESHHFTGVVEGEITTSKSGEKGFGYDPIFKPEGYDQTFAELPAQVKNQISHRAKAIEQLIAYLHENSSK